jgi:hypothetical protein
MVAIKALRFTKHFVRKTFFLLDRLCVAYGARPLPKQTQGLRVWAQLIPPFRGWRVNGG